jgi:hypothetical protein
MRSRRVLILSAIVVAACARVVDAQSVPRMLSPSGFAIACAPSLVLTAPPTDVLRIVGSQDSVLRSLFGPNELVVVDGGTQAGVQLGQEYFVRRPFKFGRVSSSGPPYSSSEPPYMVHTTGWLRVVALNDTTAIAQIDMACDGVRAGDYLEPFAAPVEPSASATPIPFAELDFSSLSRVMYGDEERRIGGTGDFMLLEYQAAGVAPGMRVALYRDLRTPDLPLTMVGEGVIVSVTNGTPLMRITSARDAIMSGDYVVPHK